ncbi:MAG TPA: radical SAM family heme chaperone HemW [Candidatus Binatia bacterium]|jgi:oxygen-independent coproporphyrinogen-3 oxidase
MQASDDPFSLYIHIPYCISKCPYCDFNSHVVAQIPETAYTDAILREMNGYAALDDWRGRTVQTIFFGGGTPSTFHPNGIARILDNAVARWRIASSCEITLEANPGTVDGSYFGGYRSSGVNRISVGVQSFDQRLLKFLGRVHSADEARRALAVVSEAGFDNFSLDLIYANPGQSLTDLEHDLDSALSFRPPHLSAYNLTIEEGTPFGHEFRLGRISLLPEEEELAMGELVEHKLGQAGLARYEISNYARLGSHSRHNVNYWRGGDYLGIGAGAHSYKKRSKSPVMAERWSNEKNPGRYMDHIRQAGHAVVARENNQLITAAGEFMFLGLRMTEGISLQEFEARFQRSPSSFYPEISTWVEEGLMEQSGGALRLSRRGFQVANSIFVNFV